MAAFHDNFSRIRIEKGLSISDVAKAVSMDPAAITLIMRREGYPRADNMVRIAKAIGISKADFCDLFFPGLFEDTLPAVATQRVVRKPYARRERAPKSNMKRADLIAARIQENKAKPRRAVCEAPSRIRFHSVISDFPRTRIVREHTLSEQEKVVNKYLD